MRKGVRLLKARVMQLVERVSRRRASWLALRACSLLAPLSPALIQFEANFSESSLQESFWSIFLNARQAIRDPSSRSWDFVPPWVPLSPIFENLRKGYVPASNPALVLACEEFERRRGEIWAGIRAGGRAAIIGSWVGSWGSGEVTRALTTLCPGVQHWWNEVARQSSRRRYAALQRWALTGVLAREDIVTSRESVEDSAQRLAGSSNSPRHPIQAEPSPPASTLEHLPYHVPLLLHHTPLSADSPSTHTTLSGISSPASTLPTLPSVLATTSRHSPPGPRPPLAPTPRRRGKSSSRHFWCVTRGVRVGIASTSADTITLFYVAQGSRGQSILHSDQGALRR